MGDEIKKLIDLAVEYRNLLTAEFGENDYEDDRLNAVLNYFGYELAGYDLLSGNGEKLNAVRKGGKQ